MVRCSDRLEAAISDAIKGQQAAGGLQRQGLRKVHKILDGGFQLPEPWIADSCAIWHKNR